MLTFDQKASVIIPVYNQWNSLCKVLTGFSNQNIPKEHFQIIVVDDGSEDRLHTENSLTLGEKYNIDIVLYHQKNKGRAAARNVGIELADNDILIFCDGDRIPSANFVSSHIESHKEKNHVIIGSQYDLFYKNIDRLFNNEINWTLIERFSRVPNYYSRIIKIYLDKTSISNLRWMSFLVGNSSVSKDIITNVGTFDEDFDEWGFEHFELGLRMQYAGVIFNVEPEAANYHIPHLRENNFYSEMIDKSAAILHNKHPEVNIDAMKHILMNNIDVRDFSDRILGDG